MCEKMNPNFRPKPNNTVRQILEELLCEKCRDNDNECDICQKEINIDQSIQKIEKLVPSEEEIMVAINMEHPIDEELNRTFAKSIRELIKQSMGLGE